MPLRKLAGYSKSGRPWVNPHLPKAEQKRIMVHERVFQHELLEHESRSHAMKQARKKEHQGLTPHQVHVYEGTIGSETKRLHGRMSYSPLRKKA